MWFIIDNIINYIIYLLTLIEYTYIDNKNAVYWISKNTYINDSIKVGDSYEPDERRS